MRDVTQYRGWRKWFTNSFCAVRTWTMSQWTHTCHAHWRLPPLLSRAWTHTVQSCAISVCFTFIVDCQYKIWLIRITAWRERSYEQTALMLLFARRRRSSKWGDKPVEENTNARTRDAPSISFRTSLCHCMCSSGMNRNSGNSATAGGRNLSTSALPYNRCRVRAAPELIKLTSATVLPLEVAVCVGVPVATRVIQRNRLYVCVLILKKRDTLRFESCDSIGTQRVK